MLKLSGQCRARDLGEFPSSSQGNLPRGQFNELELHHHVVDGQIVDIPTKEDDDANLESDLINPEIDA